MPTQSDVYETIFRVSGAQELLQALQRAKAETRQLASLEKERQRTQAGTVSIQSQVAAGLSRLAAQYLTVQTALEGVRAAGQVAQQALVAFHAAEKEAFAARSVFRGVEGLSDRMEEFARVQSRLTGIDDEAILTQSRRLYQLGLQEQQIKRLVPAIQDLAAANPEAGLSGAQSAVISALTGRTRALELLGVQFRRTGNIARDYLAIEKAIAREFGGTAAAFAATAPGRALRLGTALGNIQEDIGGRVNRQVTPFVKRSTQFLESEGAIDRLLKGLSLFSGPINLARLALGGPLSEAEKRKQQEEERRLLAQGRGGQKTRTEALLEDIRGEIRGAREILGRQTLSTGGTLAPGTVNARDLQAAIRTAR